MNNSSFYGHGKLLLTGEYAVLDGAKALGFPCKFGQRLDVRASQKPYFEWTSYLDSGEVWQALQFSKEDIVNATEKDGFKNRLLSILHSVYYEKPEVFAEPLQFSTHLEFNKNWGLGSSSTLIYNLASWASIDPYALLEKTFGGSGYDIAAAKADSAFLFQKEGDLNKTEKVVFPELLKPFIYFVYLNQKQNSREGIKHYRGVTVANKTEAIIEISGITEQVLAVRNLEDFENLMAQHERLIASLTEQVPIQMLKFPDYENGIVKSLGAWGGDFILVTARKKSELDYFRTRNYTTIFNYSDLILG